MRMFYGFLEAAAPTPKALVFSQASQGKPPPFGTASLAFRSNDACAQPAKRYCAIRIIRGRVCFEKGLIMLAFFAKARSRAIVHVARALKGDCCLSGIRVDQIFPACVTACPLHLIR